jgi:hypothetical protein
MCDVIAVSDQIRASFTGELVNPPTRDTSRSARCTTG